MRNIVVPTDFSDNAKIALSYALRLACDGQAGITLVHTLIPPVVPANTSGEVHHSNTAEEEEQAREALFQQTRWLKAQDSARFDSISIKPLLLNQSFVPGVLGAARQHSSDLIVMGTKGATGLKRILIGSNTVDLIQRTTLPVLAIPENTEFTPPRKIVMAMDVKPIIQNKHLPLLKEIAGTYKARVLIYYARQADEELADLYHKAQQYIKEALHDVPTYWYSTESRDVEESITAFVADSRAHMLVMLPRKKGLWEQIFGNSRTHSIAYRPDIPLLVLPED